MSLYTEAVGLLAQLAEETKDLDRGRIPGILKLLSIQGRIVDLNARLGQELSFQFSAKEKAYISRKIEQAKQHLRGRRELKLTSKDAEEEAILAIGEEWQNELESMSTWEGTRTLRQSLENAYDFIRGLLSFIKWQEPKSSPNQP